MKRHINTEFRLMFPLLEYSESSARVINNKLFNAGTKFTYKYTIGYYEGEVFQGQPYLIVDPETEEDRILIKLILNNHPLISRLRSGT